MGEVTEIGWTDHTFNPWIGCTKVNALCTHCYAEALMAGRLKQVKWGPKGTRVRTSVANWKQPMRWHRKAVEAGERRRVFCASLADVFEFKADQSEAMAAWRAELFALIMATPGLDWLLLTKQPSHVNRMVPLDWLKRGGWPKHVWIGTSVGTQETAAAAIPFLLEVPARVRFLSCEPLLEAVDLEPWLFYNDMSNDGAREPRGDIHWVIAGGESGPKARPMHPDWVRGLRDQCAEAGVPFFFKQWGAWLPFYDRDFEDPDWVRVPKESKSIMRINLAGGQGFHGDRVVYFNRVGKKDAGNALDGRQHEAWPAGQGGEDHHGDTENTEGAGA